MEIFIFTLLDNDRWTVETSLSHPISSELYVDRQNFVSHVFSVAAFSISLVNDKTETAIPQLHTMFMSSIVDIAIYKENTLTVRLSRCKLREVSSLVPMCPAWSSGIWLASHCRPRTLQVMITLNFQMGVLSRLGTQETNYSEHEDRRIWEMAFFWAPVFGENRWSRCGLQKTSK